MPDIAAILRTAVEKNATDIHLQAGVPAMYRINKRLAPVGSERLSAEDIEQMLFGMMTEAQRKILRERMDCDFSYGVSGLARFRVNVFHQRDSLAAAMRLIAFQIPPLETLGVPPAVVELTRLRRGFVLVTGSAGNGKSTTLAALIDRMNQERALHIVTLEDPIEYLFQHRSSIVVQREIGTDAITFEGALRAALREDPDVILVGEMRDLQTIEAALTAAETGHLVFATLHTKTPAQGIDRMVDVFPSHQQRQIQMLLANVLHGILTQQLLVRKEGDGLVLACELLIATPAVRNMIREGKTFQIQTMLQTGTASGMITMEQSLRGLVERGLITYDDALDHAFDPRELERLIGR
ncbi:MAG TPA: type IV pilus twitching motility protein PilT [Candidatus Binatia bacterium]|nr:type IV pilus twitching motility protein PilT [Candidatus Binatia bacterium]